MLRGTPSFTIMGWLIAIILGFSVLPMAGCAEDSGTGKTSPTPSEETRTVVDMRGLQVDVPCSPERVVVISRGLIDTTMYILREQDAIVGGSFYQKPLQMGQYVWDGKDYTVNTYISKVLMPELTDVQNVGGFGGPYGGPPNLETVVALDPDLVILRDLCEDVENTKGFVTHLENTGIPLVVLKYPNCYDEVQVDTLFQEISLLGDLFQKEEQATGIIDTIRSRVDMIGNRTSEIGEEERKSVLYFGAPTWAKEKGGVGLAFGAGTIEVTMLETILNARSAYTEHGRNMISAETMLALDPDVILLPTWSGYHPPRQLYGDAYSAIAELRAIRNREVYSLHPTPVNSIRLEFPLNLMIAAKAVYPERFSDIELRPWIRDYIVDLYGTNEETTDSIMEALMLDYLEIG